MRWRGREKKKEGPRGAVDIAALQSSERARRRRRRTMAVLVALAACIATGVWFVFVSPFARVAAVEISGNRETPREDIIRFLEESIRAKSRARAFLGPSYIFLWPDGGVPVPPGLLPGVRKMTVRAAYRTRTVRVDVEEREPFAVWCLMHPVATSSSTDPVPASPYGCLWFDKDGFALGEAPFAEGNLIYSVRDYSGAAVVPGLRVLAEQEMANFLSVIRVFRIADIPVEEIRLDDRSLQEFSVKTVGGPKLYFSLRFPSDSAAEVIASLRREKGAGFAKLEYVDFRVENRAFYK